MKGSKPFLQLLLGILVCAILSGCSGTVPQNGPGALNIAQFTLAQGVPGVTYRQLLIASGGVQPYTWTITSGSLPPGLSLTTDGIISGTPTMTGTFSFTVKVVDSQSPVQAVNSQNFSIMINPVLSLASMTLPNGLVGSTYDATIQASNGVAPYNYTIAFGSLPPCMPNPPCTDGTMTLTSDMPPMGGGPNTGTIKTPSMGTMAGTLSDAGVYDFTVQATDALGEVATATFSITVTGRLQGPYAFTFNGFNQGQPFYTVGSFVADGNGNITSGVMDQVSATAVNTNVTFTGTYNLPIGSTTGTITITSMQLGTSNYTIAVSTTSDSELIENDTNIYGSGLVKKQSTTALPLSISSYAFGLFGSDSGGNRYAGAGAFSVDSMLAVTGGEEDTNDNGTPSGQLAITGGTLGNPDGGTGRGTLTLTVGGNTYTYVYYTTSIMTNQLVALETDNGGPFTLVTLQPQAAGGVTGSFSNSTLTCQGPGACSVMTLNGATGSGMSAVAEAAVGALTFDGNGNITRAGIDTLPGFFADQSIGGTASQLSYCNAGDSCMYNVDTTGRVTVVLVSQGQPIQYQPVWYLVTKNQGFVVGTDPAVTSGQFLPQSGAPFSLPSLLGSYLGGTLTPSTLNVVNELDVAGTPPPGGTWAVRFDANGPSPPGYQMDQMFSGPYTLDSTYGAAFGRFSVATTGGAPVTVLYVAGAGSAGVTGGKAGLFGLNVGKYDGSADPNPRVSSLGR